MTWGTRAVATGIAALAGAAIASSVRADCTPPERVVIAEVFYDAAGDDTGHEFLELFNRSATDCPLAGVRIEVGDGSGPGRWSVRWTGGANQWVLAGDRFVIGGGAVVGADAIAALDLQNGPDAVRVVWPDGASEIVGYGAHEFAEYFCGTPAPDAPSGFSLARIPDDASSGSNAEDFRAELPSPGRPNRVARDAALVPGSLALEPAHPTSGAPVHVRAAILCRGSSALEAGTIATSFWLGDRLLGTFTIPSAVPAGDTAWSEVATESGPAGKHVLRAVIAAIGDQADHNNRDSLRVRIGPGPLEPMEIQFHPERGEGEWVEIRNTAIETVEVSAFVLADRTASGATVASGAWLAPESLAVLCQDRDAFLVQFPSLDPTRIWEARPWAALNNSDAADGFADVVRLIERDGTPCAQVSYRATGVPAGVPLERQSDGAWGPALDAAGSPLRPARPPVPLGTPFEIHPRRVAPGTPVTLEWSLPWPRATLGIQLFDLEGAFVAHAATSLESGARGALAWLPRDLAPGVYVVSLLARSPEGASVSAARVLYVAGP